MNRQSNLALATALCAACCVVSDACVRADDVESTNEVFRYVRPSGDEFVTETEIRLRRDKKGLVVTSATERGQQKLSLVTRFAADQRLQSAEVTVARGEDEQSATVTASDGTARVKRVDGRVTELEIRPGVIVTSAPDWTDAFLLVKQYDADGELKQDFAGLWIHPTREPLLLTFRITRLGVDAVKRERAQVELVRFLVELRGGSRYIVWRDGRGRMIRLMPESQPRMSLYLSGWEHTASSLEH